jgi:hypothetical protein
MFNRVLTAFLGTRHEREKKRLQPILAAIHEHEERLKGASDDEIKSQTERFRGILRETAEAVPPVQLVRREAHQLRPELLPPFSAQVMGAYQADYRSLEALQRQVASDPERFFVPPYVGPKGWVGMRLDGRPDWAEVALLVRRSYGLIAPKRLAALAAEETHRGRDSGV